MSKKELSQILAEKHNLPEKEMIYIVALIISEFKNAMLENKRIEIRNFGVFIPKRYKSKIGRIISKNEKIVIPERNSYFFKTSKTFLDLLNDNK